MNKSILSLAVTAKRLVNAQPTGTSAHVSKLRTFTIGSEIFTMRNVRR